MPENDTTPTGAREPRPVRVMPKPTGTIAKQLEDEDRREHERLETLDALWKAENDAEGLLGDMHRTGRILLGTAYVLELAFCQDVAFLDKLLTAYVDGGDSGGLERDAIELLTKEDLPLLAAVVEREREAGESTSA